MSMYFIEIHRKIDSDVCLSRFEFYNSSCVTKRIENGKVVFLKLAIIGSDLASMISHIENLISDSAFISHVSIGSDVIIFDTYERN